MGARGAGTLVAEPSDEKGRIAMSFREILRGIVEECGGGIGAALMGSDGVPIEEVVSERLPEGPLSKDISVAGG